MTRTSRVLAPRAVFRSVSSPSLFEFACPFCGKTEVSMIMGQVVFSAIVSNEELCDPVKVTLAALTCAKSHVFFVLDRDLAAIVESSAA
jgi:hypothetical protein